MFTCSPSSLQPCSHIKILHWRQWHQPLCPEGISPTMLIQSHFCTVALVGNRLKTFRNTSSWWDIYIYEDLGQSKLHERFWLKTAEFRDMRPCLLQRLPSSKFHVSQQLPKGWGVSRAQHTKSSVPPVHLRSLFQSFTITQASNSNVSKFRL